MTADNMSQVGEPAGAPRQGHPKPTHRILVVEDDGDIRRLNAEVLAHSGYHVDAAEDGAAAWDTLQRNRLSHSPYESPFQKEAIDLW